MPKAAKLAPAIPAIYIQEVKISWAKASRGGEGAVSRGRVPEAAELPLETKFPAPSAQGYPFFLHLLSYDENTKYTAWSKRLKSNVGTSESAEILNRKDVQVSFNGVILTARYKWSEALGAPKRRRQDDTGTFVNVGHSPLQKAFDVEAGQWGRILYNGRHTDYDNGTWSYDKYVFNIGLFFNPPPDVFLTTQLFKTYSKMAHLS